MGWVKFAADRLEELVFLVAARDLPGTQEVEATPERSKSEAAGPQQGPPPNQPPPSQPTETR